jgi:hypothetical protein
MGLFWDLIQQNQISEQQQLASSIEERVSLLENEVREMRQMMQTLLERLEQALNEDIDDDGPIGG